MKDYAIKALVNTVDHLGSVSYKVNDILEEKVDEVSGTELRVSCIEQVSSDVLKVCNYLKALNSVKHVLYLTYLTYMAGMLLNNH